jgi:hypothetical protein
MAAMTTALKEYSDNGNSRTYSLVGHTIVKPQLVIQKRKVPVGNQIVNEMMVSVVLATTDVDGAVLPQKVVFDVSCRSPITGDSDDVTAALAIFRDIIAGDEFSDAVNTSNWLS